MKFFSSTGAEKVTTVDVVPVGLIVSCATADAPSGWLICNGAEVLRTTYSALDSVIGNAYGYTNGSGGAGSTHLRLPDLRGRMPVGMSAGSGNRTDTNGPLTGTGQITGGSSIAAGTIGTASGSETVTLTAAQSATPAHTHTVVVGSHTHTITSSGQHRHRAGYNFAFNYINGGTTYLAANQSATETPNGNLATYNAGTGGSLTGAKASVNASSVATITVNSKSEAASSGHNNVQPFLVVNFMIKI